MRCNLTDKKNQSLKSGPKRYECWDTLLSGFGVRVTSKGRKTFFVMCRDHGRQRRINLGYYPIITLSQAREMAKEKLRLAGEGLLSVAEHQKILTVGEAVDLFIENHAKRKNKDWATAESRLKNDFVKQYGTADLRKITRHDIHRLLDEIVARGAPIQANRVLAAISRFTGWCVERGYIETSPALHIKKPAKENPRDRILNDQEIIKIYSYTENLSYPFGPLLKILILTGQRKSEVAGMRWCEIDLQAKIWTIPKERAKNASSHIVPLSPEVVDILKNLPRFLHSDFIFTTTGQTPVSGFDKLKARMDETTGVKDWIIHDIRRTVASGMARLEVPPHVVEKILNHISGSFSGVAGVYNRYGYEKEKRQALDLWAKYVTDIHNDKRKMGRAR